MPNNLLNEAKESHRELIKLMMAKIDIPVIDHIALEMASKRRYLKHSMPDYFTSNYINVGLCLSLFLTIFVWAASGSFTVASLVTGSGYVLLHRRMLWLMDRFYFLSKTHKFKRLMATSARGLYAPDVADSGYDEAFIKPVLLRYLNDSRVTGLEFWNVATELGYAFRTDFHDTRMNISEIDDWFESGRVESFISKIDSPVDDNTETLSVDDSELSQPEVDVNLTATMQDEITEEPKKSINKSSTRKPDVETFGIGSIYATKSVNDSHTISLERTSDAEHEDDALMNVNKNDQLEIKSEDQIDDDSGLRAIINTNNSNVEMANKIDVVAKSDADDSQEVGTDDPIIDSYLEDDFEDFEPEEEFDGFDSEFSLPKQEDVSGEDDETSKYDALSAEVIADTEN